MTKSKYSIGYLPRFENDLNKIVDYIFYQLQNPNSGAKLVAKIEESILERSYFPLSFQQFQSNRKREHPYYRIYVDNFTIYYIVIDDVIEIRRILYNKRNTENL